MEVVILLAQEFYTVGTFFAGQNCTAVRPISLLNIPGKVYKGFIGEAIDCHFIDGGLSSQSQWGFKSGRSTELLMLHLTEAWRQELDKIELWEFCL